MSPSTYVNLLGDAGFKAVYADQSNKSCLINLINCVLPEDVRVKDIIAYLDREKDPEIVKGKRTFLDLVCKGEDGSVFSVEVQNAPEEDFFQRCMFYAGELYYRQLQVGMRFSELRPVYVIAITDFKDKSDDPGQWNKDNLTDIYEMTSRRTGKVAPPTIFINFAKLAYFTKTLEECTSDRDYLFYWFLNGWKFDKDSFPEGLRKISAIQQLAEACEIAAFTPNKRIIYDTKLMTELDIQAQKDYAVKEARSEALAEGEAKGKAEGLAEGKAETAKNLLAMGLPIEQIVRATGLSQEEVQRL